GEWRLLAADTTDKQVGRSLSPVFRVLPCLGECDTKPAEDALAEWKSRAGVTGASFQGLCTAANAAMVVDAVWSGYKVFAFFGRGMLAFATGYAWGEINYAQPLSTQSLGLVVVEQLSCGAA